MQKWLSRVLTIRGIIAGVLASAVLMSGSLARSQVFYAYPGAPPVTDVAPAIGTTVGLGDDLFRLVGYGRFNLSEAADLGLEIVVDEFHDDWRYGAAGDVKFGIVPKNSTLPFDLSFNVGFGFQSGNDVTNINIPLGAVISTPVELVSGHSIVPYGGVYLLIMHASFDLPPQSRGDDSDTDTDIELRVGTSLLIGDTTGFFATLHIGDETMFYLGMNVGL